MKRIIILDFNRTIYNPEINNLFPDSKSVLKELTQRKFLLYLVSRANRSRKKLIMSLGIDEYFQEIVVSNQKNKRDFGKILSKQQISCKNSFVIGDRVRKEIAIGNELGLKTIWLRKGKFAGELPRSEAEKPDYQIENLKEILNIVL